jgi:hypothetical protein
MNKTAIGAFLAASSIAGAFVYATPVSNVFHSDYALTSEALVMIPVENEAYANAAADLYLEPLGFEGDPQTLLIPEVIPGVFSVGKAVDIGVADLVKGVESTVAEDNIDADNPLYIYGYSQSSVVASLAEQQLYDDGIPSDALHFVLVGDSASAMGGFLNTFLDPLPESLQNSITELLEMLGYGDVIGATTPDDLYPTDVYTLSGDGWANWDGGKNAPGLFVDHLAYLGLTPEDVASATSVTDDMTTYHLIDSADVNMFSALSEGLQIALSYFTQ